MAQNSMKKTIFSLLRTISPKRKGLMIWLGAYFQALTLGHISCPLADICIPFWVHSGVPRWPPNGKNRKKPCFLVDLDHSFYSKMPNDLVKGLFLSSDIGPYIMSTCGPLCTFLRLLGCAQMAKNSIKTGIFFGSFWSFWGNMGTPKWTQKGTCRRNVWSDV
jgi:hypothetical protein